MQLTRSTLPGLLLLPAPCGVAAPDGRMTWRHASLASTRFTEYDEKTLEDVVRTDPARDAAADPRAGEDRTRRKKWRT
jgi:hypothetical protein